MIIRRFFIRDMQAGNHLEIFLISAVSAILVIRGFLHLTGYPQISDDDLHIAHMLWGGLLMLVSILVLQMFVSKSAQSFSVIVGGIGFGAFIDEVGKFVTNDNDYFFEPSISIMYVIFILIFLTVRVVQVSKRYSPEEYLMNAIREMEEIVLHDLDQNEKGRIMGYLDKSDQKNPLVSELRSVLLAIDLVQTPSPGLFRRVRSYIWLRYRRLTSSKWFHRFIIAFFVIQLAASSVYITVISSKVETLGFVDWARFVSELVSGCFVLAGVVLIRKSRIIALQMFRRSIMISIFFTQVFVFYEAQFGALIGLVMDLLILAALQFMIEGEEIIANKQE